MTEVAFTKFPVFVDPDKEKLEKQQREEAAEASRLKNLGGSGRPRDAAEARDRVGGGAVRCWIGSRRVRKR